ncbi:MAG TPA: hypothetical protein V6C96_01750, partial [Vampirovibrionales bacterium]
EEDIDFNDYEARIEATIKKQGYRLLEIAEKSSEHYEFVIRGKSKLSSLLLDLKSFLPETIGIDLKEI